MQLVRFLMKLTSEYVQIELKNGTVVAGTILSVTPNMNTVLKDVRMTVKGEDPVTLDSITLRGSSIRYYVLPDSVQLDNMITDDTRKPSTVRPPPAKRGRGGFSQRGGRGGGPMASRGRGGGRGNNTRGRGPIRGGGFRGNARGMSRGNRGMPRGEGE